MLTQVAEQLTAKDVIRAHVRDELGIDLDNRANPLQVGHENSLDMSARRTLTGHRIDDHANTFSDCWNFCFCFHIVSSDQYIIFYLIISFLLVNWSVVWLVGWVVGWLISWWFGWLVGWSVGGSVGWFVG